MSDIIKHSGTIESIDGRHVRVRIVQVAACAACKVASHCNASESKVKIVDVFDAPDVQALAVGQDVVVTASRDVAGRALLIGFGLPFILMVAMLVAVLQLTGNEGLAALSGIGALVPYYFVVWLLRQRIAHDISFQIEI